MRLYKLRFQVEFLIRDTKQFAGLSDSDAGIIGSCQARDEKALAFHFNASFSTVNLAKLQLQQSQDPNEPFVFSLDGFKRQLFNEHLLDRFFTELGLDLTWLKSHPAYLDLVHYGSLAA